MPLLEGNGFFILFPYVWYLLSYDDNIQLLSVTTDHIGPKCVCHIMIHFIFISHWSTLLPWYKHSLYAIDSIYIAKVHVWPNLWLSILRVCRVIHVLLQLLIINGNTLPKKLSGIFICIHTMEPPIMDTLRCDIAEKLPFPIDLTWV